jgi:quercetin dioxygenase-like cupin family protein
MGAAGTPAGVTVVQPGTGEAVKVPPGFGAVFKLHSRDTGGAVSITENLFAVGEITAPHMHSREDEYSIVLEGQIGFRSDDSEVVLGPGGYIIKPRGHMHAMWNASDSPARMVETIVPGGFEGYFRELAELFAANAAEPGALAKLGDKYGLTYGPDHWLDDIVKRFRLTPPSH